MSCSVRGTVWAALLSVMFQAGTLRADLITKTPEESAFALPKNVPEVEQAIAVFQKGDYDRCLQLLRMAAAKHPDMFPGRLLLAKLFLKNNQRANGHLALEQAAGESPTHPEVYLVFGRLALEEGRVTDAGLHYEKAAALADSGKWSAPQRRTFQVGAQNGLATVAERRRDWQAAETALAAWLALEPKNGKARQRYGQACFRRRDLDKAGEELRRAVQDDPSLEPATLTLGRLYAEEGNAKAPEWLQRAVREAPDDARPAQAFAQWLLEHDRALEAAALAEAAAKLLPASREVKLLQGVIAGYQKNYEKAERYFQELIKDSPGNFLAANHLALALVEQDNDDKRRRALELAEINSRLYPDSAEALSTLGLVYYRLGRLVDAEKTLRASLASAGSSDTAYQLARVLADRDQPQEARRCLQLALTATTPFAFRREAQALLDSLEKK